MDGPAVAAPAPSSDVGLRKNIVDQHAMVDKDVTVEGGNEAALANGETSNGHGTAEKEEGRRRVEQNGTEEKAEGASSAANGTTKHAEEEEEEGAKAAASRKRERSPPASASPGSSHPKRPRHRRKVVIDRICVNPNCPNLGRKDAGLVTASDYYVAYYGVKVEKGKKRKICLQCRSPPQRARDETLRSLRGGKLAFASELPAPRDLLTLDDSDPEPESDTSSESELEVEESEGLLVSDVIKKCLEKVQVTEVVRTLGDRAKGMEPDVPGTDRAFEELQQSLDDVRNYLYKEFKPEIKPLISVDLGVLTGAKKVVVQRPQQQPQQHAVRIAPAPAARTPQQQQQQLAQQNLQKLHMTRPALTQGMAAAPQSNGVLALPQVGKLTRPHLQVDSRAYAMRGNILAVWRPGQVLAAEQSEDGLVSKYKLLFQGPQSGKNRTRQTKVLTRRHLAYFDPAPVRLQVGTRVIAVYTEPGYQATSPEGRDFYSGIVAEPPKQLNRFRYLVFFDDGYASYIRHEDVRVVVQQSANVWEDIHPNSKEFIKKYLEKYPERPMVRLQPGQVIRTEWNQRWWITKVVEVDASLVKLEFQNTDRTESIYRGSTRLSPLYLELQKARKAAQQAASGATATPGAAAGRHRVKRAEGAPVIEYTRQQDEQQQQNGASPSAPGAGAFSGGERRAVARKSTAPAAGAAATGPAKKGTLLDQVSVKATSRWDLDGETRKLDIELAPGKPYVAHTCGPACVAERQYRYDPRKHKEHSPLLIPLALGWKRELVRRAKEGKGCILYTAPCGRKLRNLNEVHRYLSTTQSDLEIDFFNLEWYVHVYNYWVPSRTRASITDLSYGKENVPVSCINSMDRNLPDYIEYSTVRLPQRDVHINTEPEFLVCCDCEDDCRDRARCACVQLTIKSTVANADRIVNPSAGYKHRRLKEYVATGIYECNSRCKCKKTCLNRVAQIPLRNQLQVFKTEKRGWGLRTLADIPQGGFVCIYVGNLYGASEGNEVGQQFGDEYFADLDLIEVVERNKSGYESDIVDEGGMDDDDDDGNLSPFNDDDESTEDEDGVSVQPDKEDRALVMHGVKPNGEASDRRTRSKATYKEADDSGDDEDDDEGAPASRDSSDLTNGHQQKQQRGVVNPDVTSTKSPVPRNKPEKLTSVRKMFGADEDVYIMDAKCKGNLGRYLNHSCDPNVFVQNCFVDTHDLRFPWVAFFANQPIKAGAELCWDYGYEPDVVAGKEIYCQCGAGTCRGRLL